MSAPAFAIPRQVPLDAPRPSLRVLSEDDLFRGLAADAVLDDVRPCACGTRAVIHPDEDWTTALARHNATTAHEAWSAQTRLVP